MNSSLDMHANKHAETVGHEFVAQGTCEASKFGEKSTVSASRSARNVAEEKGCRRHSVYRMAAAGSLSTDPKLPWPSICKSMPVS